MDMFEQLYDELKVSREIGISRRHIARWRVSHAGEEGLWGVRHGRLGLTRDGVEKMCEHLRVAAPAGYEGLELEREENAFAMRVVRGQVAGNWIQCRRVADDLVVNVFVRDAGCFVVGDEFDAKLSDKGIHVFDGSRFWPRGLW